MYVCGVWYGESNVSNFSLASRFMLIESNNESDKTSGAIQKKAADTAPWTLLYALATTCQLFNYQSNPCREALNWFLLSRWSCWEIWENKEMDGQNWSCLVIFLILNIWRKNILTTSFKQTTKYERVSGAKRWWTQRLRLLRKQLKPPKAERYIKKRQ